jgi:hypothetical protein
MLGYSDDVCATPVGAVGQPNTQQGTPEALMMPREAAWMIDEEASYTCHTRRNYYVTNDMPDGLSTSYRQTSEWHRLLEASIAIIHKQINEIGADAWCKRIASEYGPHGALLPGAVLYDEHR